MNFKRKRSRRQVRGGTFLRPGLWFGNNKGRRSFRDEKLAVVAKEQMRHG